MEHEFYFIGHNFDPVKNHDKVWVLMRLGKEKYATIWGRRGKKLSHKVFTHPQYFADWEFDSLLRTKLNKGYTEINQNQLAQVYPEFQSDLEKTAFWVALGA